MTRFPGPRRDRYALGAVVSGELLLILAAVGIVALWWVAP